MADLVRPDGRTYWLADYDETTGALLAQQTAADPPSDNSCWARGQAWGIYGFTMAYRETGDARFLSTAQKLADYYLANVPPDQVPYWDFQAPNIPNEPRDSSAAAITLSALVELAGACTNLQDSAKYWQAAHRLFTSLRSANYLAEGTSSSGILLHGTGEPPTATMLEVNVSLIYGDYYFIEALKRYRDIYSHTAVTYVPDTNFNGTDSFTYQVCDSGGDCATATVTVVVGPPLAPTPISPNTPGQSTTPYYTFNTVPGATSYTIFLWDYATESSTVFGPLSPAQVDFGTTGQGRFLQPTALALGTYTWVVSASTALGTSPWSSYMTFIVGTAPVAPVPISPNTPGQSETPYYTFNTVPGATSYTIFLWDYATESSTVFGPLTPAQVDFGTPGQGRFIQPTALAQGTYTWVVSASNTAGTSPWSTYMTFNVGP